MDPGNNEFPDRRRLYIRWINVWSTGIRGILLAVEYVCDLSTARDHISYCDIPDSKVHGANMGPIWGRQDPGGPHVGPMNFAIWDIAF